MLGFSAGFLNVRRRLGQGYSLKDFPDEKVGLNRGQAFRYEVRVDAQTKHRPGIIRWFCLNYNLSNHYAPRRS
jgi:hypothetical protein